MSQSSTLVISMAVHNDSMAVAYVAQAHDAEAIDLGPLGTRQCAIDHLIRKIPSRATHLLFVYEAGPCDYRVYRYLRQQGYTCWVVALSLA
ncbi:MAG TPA: hypothetical protein VLK82_12745 [Candidatus Tectomicrobia bacterium]|nr:hypothetical protein [Candidatus Tectomicrobia bacterium]